MAIQIVIVEDDKDVRESLVAMIKDEWDLVVVATFADAEEFIAVFKHLNMDVVLMDIHLPGADGISTVKMLKELKPAVQFVMSTAFDDTERIFASLKAGATGYLLKGQSPEKLCTAIWVARL